MVSALPSNSFPENNYYAREAEYAAAVKAASYQGLQTLEAWTNHIEGECVSGSANDISQVPATRRRTKNGRSGFVAEWISEDNLLFQTRSAAAWLDKTSGKAVKYFSPTGRQSTVFRSSMSQTIATKIEQHHKLPAGTIPLVGFWDWFTASSLPLWVTEGAKKSQAIMNTGRVAVAVAGVYNGHVATKKGYKKTGLALVPTLSGLVTRGRKVTLAFDADTNDLTIANVNAALRELSAAMVDAGAIVRRVSWASERGKGVDDLIVAEGAGALDKCHTMSLVEGSVKALTGIAATKRESFINRQDEKVHALHRGFNAAPGASTITVTGQKYISQENAKAFSDAVLSNPGTTAVMTADMGSGKTYMGIQTLKSQFHAKHPDGFFIYVAPRVTLVGTASKVLGLSHYNTKPDEVILTPGVATTLESLGKFSGAIFGERQDRPVMIVLDEWSCALAQLLSGKTGNGGGEDSTIKQYFSLRQFINHVENKGYLVLSEDKVVTRDTGFIGLPIGPIFEFKRAAPARAFYKVKKRSEILDAVFTALDKGQNVVCMTDSKTDSKAMGLVALEYGLKPSEMFILNSDTEGLDKNDFTDNPIGFAKTNSIRLVIISPSGQTGVSINDEGPNPYFALQTVSLSHLGYRGGRQMTMRLRSDSAPTVMMIQNTGVPFSQQGGRLSLCDPKALKEETRETLDSMIDSSLLSSLAKLALKKQTEGKGGIAEATFLNDAVFEGLAIALYEQHDMAAKIVADLINKKHTVLDGQLPGVEIHGDEYDSYRRAKGEKNDDGNIPNQTEIYGDIKTNEATLSANCDISDTTAEIVKASKNNPAATHADRIRDNKFTKSVIYKNLAALDVGGTPALDSVEAQLIISDDKFFDKLTLRFLVLNEEACKQRQEIELQRLAEETDNPDPVFDRKYVILSKIKTDTAKATLLSQLGLGPFMSGAVTCWNSTNVTIEMTTVKVSAMQNKKALYRLFRLSITDNQSETAIINKLLRKMGYRLSSDRHRHGEGARDYTYSIQNLIACGEDSGAFYIPSQAESLTPLRNKLEKATQKDLETNHATSACKRLVHPSIHAAVHAALGISPDPKNLCKQLMPLRAYTKLAAWQATNPGQNMPLGDAWFSIGHEAFNKGQVL